MNDIDDLQKQINDLEELVYSLVERQGLVVSHYEGNTVCTKEEEKQNRKSWIKSTDEMEKVLKEINVRKKTNT